FGGDWRGSSAPGRRGSSRAPLAGRSCGRGTSAPSPGRSRKVAGCSSGRFSARSGSSSSTGSPCCGGCWPGSTPSASPCSSAAVKLYFSDAFPDDERTRGLAARVLGELAEETEVVVLTSGAQLDEHREWVPAGPRIHDSSAWVTPQDNLAVQTALVAGARALVATYGGFSYLGPMLGVPTRVLYTQEAFQRVHLDVLHAAYPDAEYELAGP